MLGAGTISYRIPSGAGTSAADQDWLSVAFGNSIFVAVCDDGVTNCVMTSPDGPLLAAARPSLSVPAIMAATRSWALSIAALW